MVKEMISKELKEILPDIVKGILQELSLAKSAAHKEDNEKEEVLHSTDIPSDSNDESEPDKENDAKQNSTKIEEQDDSDGNSLSQALVTQEEVGKTTRQ
eukprot:9070216-Ditylum_brightwellii.AAC.1